MYRVTLIEGSNDICFNVPNSVTLGTFLDEMFKQYLPREVEDGVTSLVAEVEYLKDEVEF